MSYQYLREVCDLYDEELSRILQHLGKQGGGRTRQHLRPSLLPNSSSVPSAVWSASKSQTTTKLRQTLLKKVNWAAFSMQLSVNAEIVSMSQDISLPVWAYEWWLLHRCRRSWWWCPRKSTIWPISNWNLQPSGSLLSQVKKTTRHTFLRWHQDPLSRELRWAPQASSSCLLCFRWKSVCHRHIPKTLSNNYRTTNLSLPFAIWAKEDGAPVHTPNEQQWAFRCALRQTTM